MAFPSRQTPVQPLPRAHWSTLFLSLKPYWKRTLIIIFTTLISTGLSLIFPLGVSALTNSFLSATTSAMLDQFVVLLIIFLLVQALNTYIETYNISFIGENIVFDMRQRLYAHLQYLPLAFFQNTGTADLISRLTSDIAILKNVLPKTFLGLFQQVVVIIGSVTIMLRLNSNLMVLLVIFMPVSALIGIVWGAVQRKQARQLQTHLAKTAVISQEVLQNIREVKSFTREDYEIGRYSTALRVTLNAGMRLIHMQSLMSSLVAFTGFVGLMLILWRGGRDVIDGQLTGGDLIAFLMYGLSTINGFSLIIQFYAQITQALGVLDRVFEMLALDTEKSVPAEPQPSAPLKGRIALKEVVFGYQTDAVLNRVSLDIQPGETIAIVGSSGIGKSTLLSLLTRLYEVQAGCIEIDGRDINHFNLRDLRRNIGLVQQETLLFSSTIYDNILYGRLEASFDEVVEAAKLASAHEFIEKLPDGYQTWVGERGIKLSGGQRQRIAIARALLKNPPILLLDEATSNLDGENESLIQERLMQSLTQRTTILVTHRLLTAARADRIVVINQGQAVEVGTHEDLIRLNGLYKTMYQASLTRPPSSPPDYVEVGVEESGIAVEPGQGVSTRGSVHIAVAENPLAEKSRAPAIHD